MSLENHTPTLCWWLQCKYQHMFSYSIFCHRRCLNVAWMEESNTKTTVRHIEYWFLSVILFSTYIFSIFFYHFFLVLFVHRFRLIQKQNELTPTRCCVHCTKGRKKSVCVQTLRLKAITGVVQSKLHKHIHTFGWAPAASAETQAKTKMHLINRITEKVSNVISNINIKWNKTICHSIDICDTSVCEATHGLHVVYRYWASSTRHNEKYVFDEQVCFTFSIRVEKLLKKKQK